MRIKTNHTGLHTTNRERGQAFMELAISLVFLLILFSAVVDLGWAFYTMTALRDVAQEAATYGAMCDDEGMIEDRLRAGASAPLDMALLEDEAIKVCFNKPTSLSEAICDDSVPPKAGDIVRISITYQHQIVTPFVGAFIGNAQQYPLEVTVSDTVLAPKRCP